MLDLKHDNLTAFYGVCTEAPHVCILMANCSKGTLQVRPFSRLIRIMSHGFIKVPYSINFNQITLGYQKFLHGLGVQEVT